LRKLKEEKSFTGNLPANFVEPQRLKTGKIFGNPLFWGKPIRNFFKGGPLGGRFFKGF